MTVPKRTANGHFGTGVAYKPATATIRGYTDSLKKESRASLIQKCESDLKRAIRNRNPAMVLKFAAKLNRLST